MEKSEKLSESKIMTRGKLARIAASLREQGKIVGLTNGVFDILHAGHVAYLEQARHHCDCLIVSLNTDASVKKYKDPGRPLVPQKQRARVIAARLQRMGMAGERALLLYPPGLDYIEGFFGCLYAGVVAVPASGA